MKSFPHHAGVESCTMSSSPRRSLSRVTRELNLINSVNTYHQQRQHVPWNVFPAHAGVELGVSINGSPVLLSFPRDAGVELSSACMPQGRPGLSRVGGS